MGSPVIVDNRAGANGIIGIEHVAKSPADGYTLVVGSAGSFAINPNVYAKLPFDVVRDFAPVSLFATVPELLVVHPSLPAKSVKELVALAKARPKQLNYGSSGVGGTPHLAVELLKQAAGIDIVHVPYKGMGPATIDLIAGQVQLAFADLPVLLPQVKADKLRALAVSTAAALAQPAGNADDGRVGLSEDQDHELVRALRAGRDTEGHRRDAQRRNRQGRGKG